MPHARFHSIVALPLSLLLSSGCRTEDSTGVGSAGQAGTTDLRQDSGGTVVASRGGNGPAMGGKSATGGVTFVAGGTSAGAGIATLAGGIPTTGGKGTASGGASTGGKGTASGGASTGGKGTASGGASTGGGTGGGSGSTAACNATSLVWTSANKTNYTSYPDPGSEECVKYNGCTWAGQFAACDGTKSQDWVAAHNIVSAFPDFAALRLHDLCLRKGQKLIVATVLDTCADSDCSGCCTQNKGSAEQLIDIESYTDARWGVPDGPIEWADLGPTTGLGCN